MTDLPRLQEALQNAHRAGDTTAATALANQIRALQNDGSGTSSSTMEDINHGVNRIGTQFTKGITGLIGLPDAAMHGLQSLGDWASRQIMSEDQWQSVQEKRQQREGQPNLADYLFPHWRAFPSAQGMNKLIFEDWGVPEVNAETRLGKIGDVGMQAISGGIAVGPHAVLPAITGGLLSETAGQTAEAAGASPFWSDVARLGFGAIGGFSGAGAQDLLKAGGRGIRNAAGFGNTDATALKIAGRALSRDDMTPDQIARALRNAGPDMTIADVGGQNVRGTVRASIGSPGAARQIADDFFGGRKAGEGERVAAAIDASVSGNRGFASTIDDIVAARAAKARPLYEAAGIPSDPAQYAQAPRLASPEIRSLLSSSTDIKAAIQQAKGLPQYAGLPDDSIVLLDKAYKNLGGKAEAARQAGDNALHRDLAQQREMLKAAIVAERPEYGAALRAFSDDSALKNAIESGRKLFKGATDPEVIAREYRRLGPEGQELFRQGVAEHLRSVADKTTRGSTAANVFGGPAMRAKLQIVLGKDFDGFSQAMQREATYNRTMRDITSGSRTTPMAAEMSDLNHQAAAFRDAVTDGPWALARRFAGQAFDRVATGRNERVNRSLAQMLLDPDLKRQMQTINAINEQMRRQGLARALRGDPYMAGAGIPGALAVTQE